jgi:hypothetical protein
MKKAKMIKGYFAGSLMLAAVLMGSGVQGQAVMADARLGAVTLVDEQGFALDADYVQPDELIRLKVPVINENHGQALPAGSCMIKIGLGSKLVLDPAYDLNSTAMNRYFRWTAAPNSGQQQIIGELIAPLPASLEEVNVAFRVKGAQLGNSAITANFLITNHNTRQILSDEDGANNASFLNYKVSNRPAPATVTTVTDIAKTGCTLEIRFAADREVNLSRFEIEAGRNESSFERIATVSAIGALNYAQTVEIPASLRAQQIFVRIRTIERSGRSFYTAARSINGQCAALPLKLTLYPNPASKITDRVTIATTQGLFSGQYRVRMMDMSGKLVLVKDINLAGVPNFVLPFGNIASGKYLIQLSTAEQEVAGLLQFERL